MGQAKLRKAEINELKAAGPRDQKSDLNNLMMSFGDEPGAEDIRFDLLRALLQIPLANKEIFERNARLGKTTHMGELDFQIGDTKIDVNDIYFGLNDPAFGWPVINKVLSEANPKKLRPMVSFDRNNVISTGFGYNTPTGCLVIRHNRVGSRVHTYVSIDRDFAMMDMEEPVA